MFIANGCLLFNSVEYEITPGDGNSGSAILTVEDIRSDAINSNELDEDKKNLFDFMHKSDEFIKQMKGEGKIINSRELIVDGMVKLFLIMMILKQLKESFTRNHFTI
jgi:hypothetical protein